VGLIIGVRTSAGVEFTRVVDGGRRHTEALTGALRQLLEEIELLGPVRMQQVEEARDVVIKAIRALEEAGSLVVSRGADDLVM